MTHQTSLICKAAKCANRALGKSVCRIVSVAALEHYAHIVEVIKNTLCIDINKLFGLIALLAVLCWISQWISEIINFVTKTVPQFIKNLCQGKFSLCLLDCQDSGSSFGSSSSEHDESDSTEY